MRRAGWMNPGASSSPVGRAHLELTLPSTRLCLIMSANPRSVSMRTPSHDFDLIVSDCTTVRSLACVQLSKVNSFQRQWDDEPTTKAVPPAAPPSRSNSKGDIISLTGSHDEEPISWPPSPKPYVTQITRACLPCRRHPSSPPRPLTRSPSCLMTPLAFHLLQNSKAGLVRSSRSVQVLSRADGYL